jgi:threonine dehydrogenase-like Zn-dependent dehydrogenase
MIVTSTKVVIDRPRKIAFQTDNIDCDQLDQHDVVAETIFTAISPGTEIAAYTGVSPLRPSVQYPRLIGYCNVAEVICVGRLVNDLKVGSRILTFSSHCSHFKVNRREVLAKIPPNMKSEHAVCAYLYHLGYSTVLRSDVRLGSSVVVIGLGVLGLTSVSMAAKAGANVYAVSDQPSSHALANRYGAKRCYERSKIEDLIVALGEELSQIVIATTNSWEDWGIALKVAGNQGLIAVLGFPGRGAEGVPLNPLDSQYFYQRQLKICAAGSSPEFPDSRGFLPFNERQNIGRILRWIDTGELRPEDLVSGTYDAKEIKQAYEHLIGTRGSSITFLLRWQSPEHRP